MRPRRLKRAVDVVLSSIGLLVLAPLLGVIAVAVLCCDGRPVLFRHRRIGRGGAPFDVLKFRTMGPPKPGAHREVTVASDPRITPLGAVLRRYKLDELPQLVNVMRGEMSLVGPRPEAPRYVALYDAQQQRVLDYAPGVTDVASLAYRHENNLLEGSADPERTYIEEVMPAKLRMSLDYAEHATTASDLRLIAKTALKLVA